MAQMVYQLESEKLAYDFLVEAYGRRGAERTEIGRAVAVRVAWPRMRGGAPEELRDEI